MNKVVITGIGLISPLGSTINNIWPRILSRETEAHVLSSRYDKLPCRIAAIIDEKIYNYIKESLKCNENKTMSRASILMMHAASDAMKDANLIDMDGYEQHRCGVSIGIGFDGAQESVEANKFNITNDVPYNLVGPYALTKSLGNMPCAHVGIYFKMKGPSRSVNTACAAGLHAIGDAFRTVQYDEADIMLAGGVEASITPWSIAAFSRIRALPTNYNDNPKAASWPFDIHRSGFLMSEGAGCVVLESLDHALRRGKQPLVEVLGFGQSCDAFSLVAPDSGGNGAYRSMEAALKWAGIGPEQVGYVNAHATSTPQGDVIECKAIERLFGCRVPVGSFKGSLGHCLGGSGAVEAALTVHCLVTGQIAPNTNLERADPTIRVNLVAESPIPWTDRTRIAVTNAFGFGGTNCSLVLRHCAQ